MPNREREEGRNENNFFMILATVAQPTDLCIDIWISEMIIDHLLKQQRDWGHTGIPLIVVATSFQPIMQSPVPKHKYTNFSGSNSCHVL